MLILGRREGDSIIIDGGIRIVVVSCDRGGVRIGIEAPSSVKILRGEIAQQVAQENQRAAAPTDASWLATLGAPVAPAAATAPVAPSADAAGAAPASTETA
jgi:carbon storage regulator